MSNSVRFSLILVCLISSSMFCAYGQNPGDNVFSGIQVHTVKLTFAQPNYWDSLVVYYNAGDEQLMMANAVIDGVAYDSIGVRLKGNSSFTYPNNKKSFKLNFDEYRDLKWDNLKAVHLNNMWGDPTFMREKVHLDFCRDEGMAAPRGNYAELTVNDTLFGLYSLVEHVDKKFLKTHFGNSDGDLFKAVDGFVEQGSTSTSISDFKWYGDQDTSYTSLYELKTDGSKTAWPQLIHLIDVLNNNADYVDSLQVLFNLTSLYKAVAVDNIFANLDSYINSGRNFYVYFNTKTKKTEWIIWDAGLSFGAFPGGVPKAESMNVLYLLSATDRPLVGRVFASSLLKNDYLMALCTMFHSRFTTDLLFAHIDSIASIIRPYVVGDPRKMYTVQQFETNITSDINAEGGGGTRKPGLKSFITSRISYIDAQLTALGIDCSVGVEQGDGADPQSFALAQNWPNPFSASTNISFVLPTEKNITLDVYNVLGTRVARLAQGRYPAGSSSVRFDASSLPGGLYLCLISDGTTTLTRSMMVVHEATR